MNLTINTQHLSASEIEVILDFEGEIHTLVMSPERANLFVPTLRAGLSLWNDRELVEVEVQSSSRQSAFTKGE